jgi:hypothetical protein
VTFLQVHPSDLEPSLIERRFYVTRRRRHLFDIGVLLSLTVGLAMLIPADQVVPQLTVGIGRPALLMGLALAAGWTLAKFHPRLAVRGPQPLRWAAAVYLTAIMLAYAAGQMRGLTELESGGADRALLATLGFLGVALVCADGPPNRARLDDVLRAVVWFGGVMGAIGLVQFAFRFNVVELIQVPGLTSHRDEALGFSARGGDDLVRVASTATHYIEFSTVMAMALPVAVHTARFARTPLARQGAVVSAVIMAAAIPVTLSRSGILALFAGMLVLGFFWSWRMRLNMAVMGLGLMIAIMLVRPGLLGTIRSLFTNLNNDPSVEGRTEDYAAVGDYLAQRPWLGRGPGTFIPTIYRFLDNEWLMHLITTGYLGTAAFAGLHLTALGLAAISYRRATHLPDRHLCACLISVQVMAMLVAGTFDVMSFTTHTTLLALLTGAAGAMWRFTHPGRLVRSAAPLPVTNMPDQDPRRSELPVSELASRNGAH